MHRAEGPETCILTSSVLKVNVTTLRLTDRQQVEGVWHIGLGCALKQLHPIWKCPLESWLLCFAAGFLLLHPGRQQAWLKGIPATHLEDVAGEPPEAVALLSKQVSTGY